MSQKTERKTSKKKGKKSKKKVSNFFAVIKQYQTILSAQKVEVVVEVDLTSDKAKNDMIQVTSEHLCKLIHKTYFAQALLAKTDLGEEELNVAYDEFYQLYPGGEISEQQFLLISKVAV